MKRILTFAAMLLLAVLLVGDLGLLLTYLNEPDAFAMIEQVSFLHYLLLHSHGLEFAILRMLLSALLLILWVYKFIYPSPATVLKNATFAYAGLWVLIGVMVLTGVTGVLQNVAGLQVDLLDFSVLLVGLGHGALAMLVVMVFGVPSGLLIIPALYSNCFKTGVTDR